MGRWWWVLYCMPTVRVPVNEPTHGKAGGSNGETYGRREYLICDVVSLLVISPKQIHRREFARYPQNLAVQFVAVAASCHKAAVYIYLFM